MAHASTEALRLRIKSATWEAPNIVSYDLRPVDARELPPFAAGAHIDLQLGNGMTRSYSLVNPQSERHRYVIAVQRDRASRGGSTWVHDHFRPGDVIVASAPRNNFALHEGAARTILIAGGIGITPIMGMIHRLDQLGRDWQLIYCCRTRAGTAFLDRLEGRPGVRFNFDEEPGGAMLDVHRVVAAAPEDAHLYCCGPLPMLEAFEEATRVLPRDRVHVEYFSAREPPAVQGGFTVVLARSGRELEVVPGKTVLQTLLEAGFDVPYSCTEGVCGTCETRVLAGIPDHRDLVLSEADRASNQTMMICCSGSRTDKLVLDL